MDVYEASAHYYDAAYEADEGLQDLPFWLDLTQRYGGRVLEAGCGTGRVLLTLARAGVRVDGLDMSPAMLDVLRTKLAAEPAEVQNRVRVFPGDMRDFSLDRTYDLVLVPFRGLQHMHSLADQTRAFSRLSGHLKPGGILAFNLFYPNHALLEKVGEEVPEMQWLSPDHLTVKRSFIRRRHDRLNQNFDGEFNFRTYRDLELLKEERSNLKMTYYTYPQVQLLLRQAGLQSIEEYGDFAKNPIHVCQEMIFVAQKL